VYCGGVEHKGAVVARRVLVLASEGELGELCGLGMGDGYRVCGLCVRRVKKSSACVTVISPDM
jgi:hypothetical protein